MAANCAIGSHSCNVGNQTSSIIKDSDGQLELQIPGELKSLNLSLYQLSPSDLRSISFEINPQCNVAIQAIKVRLLGSCHMRVIISDSRQPTQNGQRKVLDRELVCSDRSDLCWRNEGPYNLPPGEWNVAGRVVSVRISPLGVCFLLFRRPIVWAGAALLTTGKDPTHGTLQHA